MLARARQVGELCGDPHRDAFGRSAVRELALLRDDLVPASPYIGIYRAGRAHLLRLDKIASSGLRTASSSLAARSISANSAFGGDADVPATVGRAFGGPE